MPAHLFVAVLTLSVIYTVAAAPTPVRAQTQQTPDDAFADVQCLAGRNCANPLPPERARAEATIDRQPLILSEGPTRKLKEYFAACFSTRKSLNLGAVTPAERNYLRQHTGMIVQRQEANWPGCRRGQLVFVGIQIGESATLKDPSLAACARGMPKFGVVIPPTALTRSLFR